ncbi:MAG: ABC transporter ATP-binding protein [Desulfomonile tiedjei]|uniref:ABC transporter ATP-binding protein n=1 Tax=Desulfomonile tiedjei TaxID=2358 RepID=A0A9D6V0L6_9BACT|nr:ABC transporter ATP-binding protein [Desulfomonile tiedjei]
MERVEFPRNQLFRKYFRDLLHRAGLRAILAVFLLVAVGLTEGVGLLMLIPFLQLIGIGDSTPSGVVAVVEHVWKSSGLPMTLPAVLSVYALIVSAYALVQWWSTILNSKLSHAITRELRDELFEAMARVQWLRFTQIRGSDINTAMTANLNAVESGTYGLFMLISTAFVVAVHMGVALTLSVPLTCVAIASSATLVIILRPLNRQSYRLGEEWRRTMAALYGVLMEHLGGMKLAKSFGAEARHIRSFCSLSGGLETQANRFAGILSSTQMYYEIGGALVLCLFFYVAVEILQIAAAKLLILVFLFARLVPQFSWMQRTWQGVLNMLPAYGAAMEMAQNFRCSAESLPSDAVAPIQLKKEVELRGVSFRYEKADTRPVLQGIDLTLPAFQTTVILGPSGGGKSTLADLLIGLLTPDDGEILVDGTRLDGALLHAWRRSVGYVPQESVLFHETIRENLLWARPEAQEEEIWEALRLAAADEFVSELPQGLDTIVGDRGLRLSGGQRQRIALARALLRKPVLLLLDEATSNLDQKNERRILEALEGLQGKMTVAIISHRLAAVQCADQVITIEGGMVAQAQPGGTYRRPSRLVLTDSVQK